LHIDGNAPANTMNLTSQVRHFLTYLAGIGGALAAWNIIAPEQVVAVNEAGGQLVEPLVVIIGAIAAGVLRLAMDWFSKRFSGKEKTGSSGNSRGESALLLMVMGTAVAVIGSLPSCSPAGWSVSYEDPMTDGRFVVLGSKK
jgi:hypothetical protein